MKNMKYMLDLLRDGSKTTNIPCEQNIDCSDGFESMCESICICCECGIILFPCDVKWVDSRKKTCPYRASKFENLSYSLTIVTMDKDGVLKVACCRHW